MKRFIIVLMNVIMLVIIVCSCSKETKRPYGAVDIEYKKVEELNIEGPSLDESHDENIPPNAPIDLNLTDEGPKQNDETENNEPTADMDSEPDYGGIPIVTKASAN